MSEINTDVTVVGGGIAGLWTAKELVDEGFTVSVIEKSKQLANGATTRNEGWLHAGTYHSVAIYDETDAANVTARTIYGHDSIVNFAPEAIEHGPTIAFLGEDEVAHNSLSRWGRMGVQYREVAVAPFAEQGFDTSRIRAAFEVKDKSVDSRMLCGKLAQHIESRGGRIFTDTEFHPVDSGAADIIADGERRRINAGCFVVAAGVGSKAIFEEITGKPFPMQYHKSHLLVTPRITTDNFFYLDPLEGGIMSHGDASIIGINREAVTLGSPDYEVMAEKHKMIYDALVRMLPRAQEYRLGSQDVQGVACVKVDIASGDMVAVDPNVVRQDLNIKVFEPADGYVCALPGKMTEAPFLAKKASEYVMGRTLRDPVAAIERANLISVAPREVTMRPADTWMSDRTKQAPQVN